MKRIGAIMFRTSITTFSFVIGLSISSMACNEVEARNLSKKDPSPPSITAFSLPLSSPSLTVSGIVLTASDNKGVTGYLVKETSGTPVANATGWTSAAPGSYTFSSAGSKSLYAWAKDAAGNISSARSATVVINLVTPSPTPTPTPTPTTPPSTAVFISAINVASQTVSITGQAFGTKSNAAPLLFTSFETDIAGQVPAGWTPSSATNKSTVTGSASHSGSQSLDSSAFGVTSEYFNRITYDTRATVPQGGSFFLSAWVFLDETGTTASVWNWKGPLITSSPQKQNGHPPYWEPFGTLTNNTAWGASGWYYHADSPRWGNTALTTQISNNGVAAYNYCTAGNGDASDTFAFNSWHRVDWIFKTSSTPGSADGVFKIVRDGVPKVNATGCISNGTTGNAWRYVSLPQGITNVFIYATPTAGTNRLVLMALPKIPVAAGMTVTGNGIPAGTTITSFDGSHTITMSANATASEMTAVKINGNGGTLNLKMHFDDVYVDNGIARVEMCDSATWGVSAHCELQPAQSWSNTGISATLNKGTFASGNRVYFYVVTASGAVNANGFPATLP